MSDSTTQDPKGPLLVDVAVLRAYGYHFDRSKEDTTRCAAETSPVGRGNHPCQCSRPRGHGPDGLLCKQHAAKPAVTVRIPEPGGWGRLLLERLQSEAAALRKHAERLATVEKRISVLTFALAELTRVAQQATKATRDMVESMEASDV